MERRIAYSNWLSGAILAFASGAVVAQNLPEVIVEAPHAAVPTKQPIGPHGMVVPAVSITYRVSYADLNIATHSGAMELEKRIKDAAKDACEQLTKLYPESAEGEPPCVEGAIKKAMVRAHEAITAAERAATKP